MLVVAQPNTLVMVPANGGQHWQRQTKSLRNHSRLSRLYKQVDAVYSVLKN
jgi:hypothetical protein